MAPTVNTKKKGSSSTTTSSSCKYKKIGETKDAPHRCVYKKMGGLDKKHYVTKIVDGKRKYKVYNGDVKKVQKGGWGLFGKTGCTGVSCTANSIKQVNGGVLYNRNANRTGNFSERDARIEQTNNINQKPQNTQFQKAKNMRFLSSRDDWKILAHKIETDIGNMIKLTDNADMKTILTTASGVLPNLEYTIPGMLFTFFEDFERFKNEFTANKNNIVENTPFYVDIEFLSQINNENIKLSYRDMIQMWNANRKVL